MKKIISLNLLKGFAVHTKKEDDFKDVKLMFLSGGWEQVYGNLRATFEGWEKYGRETCIAMAPNDLKVESGCFWVSDVMSLRVEGFRLISPGTLYLRQGVTAEYLKEMLEG